MKDFESFQKALAAQGSRNENNDGDGDPNYMDSLMHSMSLVLDEFYQHLKVRAPLSCIIPDLAEPYLRLWGCRP